MDLPNCGLYRTTADIGGVPADRLVYFHNHGDPGPGLYLPEEWHDNRARFGKQGRTLTDLNLVHTLEPLAPEGFYRVVEPFTCCEKNCRTYEAEVLLQVGYNARGQPILFVPQWSATGLVIPERGNVTARERVDKLVALKVATAMSRGTHAPEHELH